MGAVAARRPFPEAVRDSKRLSEPRRGALHKPLSERAQRGELVIGVGEVSAEEIDWAGMSEALRRATNMAVLNLGIDVDAILIDGPVDILGDVYFGTVRRICGPRLDALASTVAAASIIAKVFRDSLMRDLGVSHPHFGFAQHEGYGTSAHMDSIRVLGATPVHRRTFLTRTLDENSPGEPVVGDGQGM